MEKKNKKSNKKASELFHNKMAASVKDNLKPKKKSAPKEKNIEVKEIIIKAVVSPKKPPKK